MAELCKPSENLLSPRFDLLTQWGFLDEEKNLTPLGLYATEINEGNQLLMAKAYEERCVKPSVMESLQHSWQPF